jgi:hypothetical protein
MNEQLHWLAYLYVAGEMAPEEEELFESRLANDQAAREVVAQTVELMEAVRLVAAEQAPARRGRVSRVLRHPATWAAGLAACLLLAGGLWWLASTTPHDPDRQHRENAAEPRNDRTGAQTGEELARAWAELRHTQDREALGPDSPPPEPLASNELGMEDMTATEVSVPQWMLTALSAPNKQD